MLLATQPVIKKYRPNFKMEPEYHREYWQKYQKNPDKQKAIRRNRRRRTLKKYGLDEEKYFLLASVNNNLCWLCDGKNRLPNLAVDHDHGCFEGHIKRHGCAQCVRGLLCDRCNYEFLPFVTRNPDLQSAKVKKYLACRPMLHFQFVM